MKTTDMLSSLTHMKKYAGVALATVITASAVAAPPPPPVYEPDILVTGMSTAIYTGSVQPLKLDGTYFGQAQIGVNSWEHTFEIRNFGDNDLHLIAGGLSGDNAGDFVVTQWPDLLIPPGQRTSFKLRYIPSFEGNAFATVNIVSNDPVKGEYNFQIRGDGTSEPLVGADLRGDLVFYKKYKCKGIPLLFCKMQGKVEIQNMSTDYHPDGAFIRVYAVDGDVLTDGAHLVAEKWVKKKKIKPFKPGKKNKPSRIKFKGYVPPGYTHIYAEVVPADGSEDINYTNNRAEHLYGLF